MAISGLLGQLESSAISASLAKSTSGLGQALAKAKSASENPDAQNDKAKEHANATELAKTIKSDALQKVLANLSLAGKLNAKPLADPLLPQRVTPPESRTVKASDSQKLCIRPQDGGDPGVIVDLIEHESLELALEKHEHPLQDGTKVTDHATRPSFKVSLTGKLVSNPPSEKEHERKFDRLKSYRDKATRLEIVCNFPPKVIGEVLLTKARFMRQAPNMVRAQAYMIEFDLEESQIAGGGHSLKGSSAIDPATGLPLGKDLSNLGQLPPLSWGAPNGPSPDKIFAQTKSGKQPGDGGIFGFIKKAVSTVENAAKAVGDFAKTDLGKAVIGAAEKLVSSAVPGAGPALAIINAVASGDFSANSIANIAASLIPGGGVIKDVLSGVAGKAIDFVASNPEAGKVVSDLLAGKGFNKEAATAAVVGAVATAAGSLVPALAPAANIVAGALLDPQGTKDGIINSAMSEAAKIGIPLPLLDVGKSLVGAL